MRRGNFDKVAGIYDLLAFLVFGNAIRKAQQQFLTLIKDNDTVLILGGGTGWILNHINPNCKIVYIEASPAMISLASRKGHRHVTFITGTEDFIPVQEFDVIITPFFLDLFEAPTLIAFVDVLKNHMQSQTKLIAVDFVNERVWHPAVLTVMYLFFRAITGLKTKQLPPWQSILSKAGLRETAQAKYYCGFIRAAVYTRT